jgi:hypothetical protein
VVQVPGGDAESTRNPRRRQAGVAEVLLDVVNYPDPVSGTERAVIDGRSQELPVGAGEESEYGIGYAGTDFEFTIFLAMSPYVGEKIGQQAADTVAA